MTDTVAQVKAALESLLGPYRSAQSGSRVSVDPFLVNTIMLVLPALDAIAGEIERLRKPPSPRSPPMSADTVAQVKAALTQIANPIRGHGSGRLRQDGRWLDGRPDDYVPPVWHLASETSDVARAALPLLDALAGEMARLEGEANASSAIHALQFGEWQASLRKSEERAAELEKALEPFGKTADLLDLNTDWMKDECQLQLVVAHPPNSDAPLSAGDFRRARAAIGEDPAQAWPEAVSDGLVLSCSDCGQRPRWDYRVMDEFWRQHVTGDSRLGVICLPCLELRCGGVGLAEALIEVQWLGTGHTVVLRPSLRHRYGGEAPAPAERRTITLDDGGVVPARLVENIDSHLTPATHAPERAVEDALLSAIANAQEMVSALCKPRGSEGSRSWTMSIPAQPDYDPDLVITAGLRAGLTALNQLATPTTPDRAMGVLRQAAEQAQRALAMLIAKDAIERTVLHAYAQAVAAETKLRAALQGDAGVAT